MKLEFLPYETGVSPRWNFSFILMHWQLAKSATFRSLTSNDM